MATFRDSPGVAETRVSARDGIGDIFPFKRIAPSFRQGAGCDLPCFPLRQPPYKEE